mgnify:CR=1 FL=1
MSFVDEYILYCDTVKIAPTVNGNPLIWRDDLGIGYLRSNGYQYSEQYWERYQEYNESSMGERLTLFRESFVAKHFPDFNNICDIGIGSGQFVKHVKAKGYDINPYAKNWLELNGLYGNPYKHSFSALTFWDVLEHFDDPSLILSKTDHIFMSIPIHENLEACYNSKHLRPDEHIWHFTRDGLIFFMKYYGFELVEESDGETKAGRESIMSYYFRRLINIQ